MHYRDIMTIGVNHHLLCKFMVPTAADHAATLIPLLGDERYDHFDLWIRGEEPYRSEEMAAIRDCGRPIIYNVGDRDGEPELLPTSTDPVIWQRTLDAVKREIERGLEVGTKKIVTSSGRPHGDPAGNMEQLVAYYCALCAFVGKDVEVLVEPTDTDFDKRYLIGPSAEAMELIRRVHQEGYTNMGGMLDMCHLPPLHERVEDAFDALGTSMRHVHLGTCVTEDKTSAFYGDKHPGWGLPGVCWDEHEVADLMVYGYQKGYFSPESRGTVSFEMVAYDDIPYLQSTDRFFAVMDKAWALAEPRILALGQA